MEEGKMEGRGVPRPIACVTYAADRICTKLEALGFGTRKERSNTSNGSLYVFAFLGDGGRELKIRVSNHAATNSALWHRPPDFEVIISDGRHREHHAIEYAKAWLRASAAA